AHPDLRLFQLGPAGDALDLAAKAFPLFAPQPRMTDPAPLTQAPGLPPAPGMTAPPRTANLAVAMAMIGVALIILALGIGPHLHRWAAGHSNEFGTSHD
ncbi:MAG: hypothetical protein KDD91_05095, partial [Caldilinea sp.]|nr:hypothetical protein [Caldilinea sp.]